MGVVVVLIWSLLKHLSRVLRESSLTMKLLKFLLPLLLVASCSGFSISSLFGHGEDSEIAQVGDAIEAFEEPLNEADIEEDEEDQEENEEENEDEEEEENEEDTDTVEANWGDEEEVEEDEEEEADSLEAVSEDEADRDEEEEEEEEEDDEEEEEIEAE